VWYNNLMNIEDFRHWIKEEIDRRYWTYNELARQADLSSAFVSMVMTGQRNPGEKFCHGIAKAFDLPIDDIFRRAGILPPIPDLDANAEAMLHLFRNLPESEQERVLTIMRALSTMHATAADDANGSNNTTKGE